MSQPNVCDLLKGQRFEGFLLVRSSEQRTGGNGAKYLDLNLADRTGSVGGEFGNLGGRGRQRRTADDQRSRQFQPHVFGGKFFHGRIGIYWAAGP